MTPFERMARLADRMFDRMRDERAFDVGEADAVVGDFESLRGRTYAVLVTFRRSGEAVPSPVWIGVDGSGKAYVKTRRDAGKVKRIRNDDRALVAPSNARGKATGPAVRARARVLPKEEWPHAEATLTSAYGAGRRISERLVGGPDDLAAYVELTPASS
ncbi:MAG TPA: PPOX class F420-dependent oxidoreductase [Acidimicrobiales bacterium]